MEIQQLDVILGNTKKKLAQWVRSRRNDMTQKLFWISIVISVLEEQQESGSAKLLSQKLTKGHGSWTAG